MPWLPLVPFAIFFVWLFLFGMRSTPPCPDCGKALSAMQSPLTKTERQWIEGGYLCKHCGCESDNKGQRVEAGTRPSPKSIYVGLAIVAVAAVPAIVMFTLLSQR